MIHPMRQVRHRLREVVKICGITREEDLLAAAEAGADAVGFNLWPGSKRHVDLETCRELVAAAPPGLACVGVFVDADYETLREAVTVAGLTWVQLHGDEEADLVDDVRALGVTVIKAVSPADATAAEAAVETFGAADALLVDAGAPGAPGGTGRRADWPLARELAGRGPVILAGGLTPDSVADAIRAVAPAGVDVASGVESAPGIKDPAAVAAFVRAARAAFPLARAARPGSPPR